MKNDKKTSVKNRIIEASWKLFLEQGYENTTIEQIVKLSNTSRGAFYHHFHGKEEVLFYIAYRFDEDYEKWWESVDPNLNALEKLKEFNLFVMESLENSPYRQLFATLYGLQVMTSNKRHIINPDRTYYKIISAIIKEGIDKGEIKSKFAYQELTEWYAILERGLTYDWCLKQGRYSLVQYGQQIIKAFIDTIKA